MARYQSGFTIIETTLVMAITGLVIVMILAGIGSSLNHQRYTDAVNQATDFFRGQYTSTTSVLNNRSPYQACDEAGDIRSSNDEVTLGSTDCLPLGRIIRSDGGGDITVHQIVALHDPSDDPGVAEKSDRDILVDAKLRASDEVLQTYQPEWGTRLLQAGTDDGANFTIMIVRTPVSGTVQTYMSDSATTPIQDLFNPSVALQTDLSLCIDQNGFFSGTINPVGVKIMRNAANTTGVQIIPSGECV